MEASSARLPTTPLNQAPQTKSPPIRNPIFRSKISSSASISTVPWGRDRLGRRVKFSSKGSTSGQLRLGKQRSLDRQVVLGARPSRSPYKSQPEGLGIWAITSRQAAELGSPSCTWQEANLLASPPLHSIKHLTQNHHPSATQFPAQKSAPQHQ